MEGQKSPHPPPPYPMEEHHIRIAVGDQEAVAYEAKLWMFAYLDQLNAMILDEDDYYDTRPITYEELMNVARRTAEGDEWQYISRGPAFEGVVVDYVFWDKFEKIEGIKVPESNKTSFFSCSC